MRSVCLIFQVHLPLLLNRYRFFEIGEHYPYLDEAVMESQQKIMAKELLLPMNHMLLRQIKSRSEKFRVAFYLSGITLDQFRNHTPELYDSFRVLANTGNAEFMTGTYSFSLASLYNDEAFRKQVTDHRSVMEEFSRNFSDVFYNTGLIYNDRIGEKAAAMGFGGLIAEGARHILGWRSSGKVYCNVGKPDMKVLFRHPELSDDMQGCLAASVRATNQPSPAKLLDRLASSDTDNGLINLIIDLAPLCSLPGGKSGITGFLDHFLFLALQSRDFKFITPTEITRNFQTDSPVHSPNPVSRNSEGSYEPEWTQNELQQEALSKLYAMTPEILSARSPEILRDWNNLQCAEHFKYMDTQLIHAEFLPHGNPFESPFEAFINYMNILNDFKIRLDQPSEM
jgi:alpha-amylase